MTFSVILIFALLPKKHFDSSYLCNMSEDELRLMSARATAEVMINTVKVNDSEHPWFDMYVLSTLLFLFNSLYFLDIANC